MRQYCQPQATRIFYPMSGVRGGEEPNQNNILNGPSQCYPKCDPWNNVGSLTIGGWSVTGTEIESEHFRNF